jgi:serine protease inhibitor
MAFKLPHVRTVAWLLALAAPLAALGAYRGACTVPMARSELSRDTKPQANAGERSALVAGSTAFAVDALKRLGRTDAQANVLFSPYSISVALSMAYAGAGGQTASGMAAAMHYPLPPDQLHRAFGALDLEIASGRSDGTVLKTANSLWAREKMPFEKPFLDRLAQGYGAGVRLADFEGDPEGSRKRINGWVASETGQKIRGLLGPRTVDSLTRLVLVNAAYFCGRWADPFDPKSTQPGAFSRLDGSTVQVPMMYSRPGTAFSQGAAYDAVELRYVGRRMAMDIVMPKAESFAAFESGLTGASFESIVHGMQSDVIDLAMPRFSLAGVSTSLKELLEALGMSLAFDPLQADFSAIATPPDGRLYLSDVLHQASVTVNEQGTEAAAASAAVDGVFAARPPDIVITIDHPFFFVLRDVPTGVILFAGRVMDPSGG